MKRALSVLLVLAGVGLLGLGLLFLVGMGGQFRRGAVGAVGLLLGAALMRCGVQLYRRAAASLPEQLRSELMDLARRHSGEISATEVQAALGRRAAAAEAVLRELGHEGVCVEQQKGGVAYFVFADLQPRLLVRRCEYCQAELPLNQAFTECPRCGGSFEESVERRALSEAGLYRMDE